MGIGVYRFLRCFRTKAGSTVSLGSGPFESLPFLPRVTYRNVILSPAQWTVATSEVRDKKSGDAAFRSFANGPISGSSPLGWPPRRRQCPAGGPRERAQSARVPGRDRRTLPFHPHGAPLARGAGVVTGPEGTFANESSFRSWRASVPAERPKAARPDPKALPLDGTAVQFMPGSEWLFARFNTAPGFADAILVDSVAPVIESLRRDRVADDWFFIRYSDPEFHLRLRIRGAPRALAAEALPMLHEVADGLLARGLITKVPYDTYDRELQRYGGPNGIELCERIFGIDSDAVLELVASTLGDEGAVARWQLTLCGSTRSFGTQGWTWSSAISSWIAGPRCTGGSSSSRDSRGTRSRTNSEVSGALCSSCSRDPRTAPRRSNPAWKSCAAGRSEWRRF